MKVLFFTHWFPTEENPQKGVFILEQAKALKKVGVEITLVHVRIESGSGLINNEVIKSEIDGITTLTIDLRGSLWKLFYTVYPMQLHFVRKALKKANVSVADFNLFHSHVIHPAGAIGHRLAEEANVPHFISEHWSNLSYYFENNWFKNWGKTAYEKAVKIFVVSHFLKERTAQFVANTNKLEVIPNVVPSDDFKFRPAPIGSSYYLLMAAKWNKSKRVIKRPKLLIKAVAEASKQLNKPVILGVIGDGDRLSELKKYCEKNDVHAQFHGFVSKKVLAAQLQKADLFLHGSDYETFSVVIAEALKCGTPVVASDVAAIPELIDESNGILVENKLTPWKNAIEKALGSKYDNQAIAASYKSKFGYVEVGEKLLAAYRQKP